MILFMWVTRMMVQPQYLLTAMKCKLMCLVYMLQDPHLIGDQQSPMTVLVAFMFVQEDMLQDPPLMDDPQYPTTFVAAVVTI